MIAESSNKHELDSLSKKNIKVEAKLKDSESNIKSLMNVNDEKDANNKNKMAFLNSMMPILSDDSSDTDTDLPSVIKTLPHVNSSRTITYELLSFIIKDITKEEVN
jgi:hypothetical protein